MSSRQSTKNQLHSFISDFISSGKTHSSFVMKSKTNGDGEAKKNKTRRKKE